MTMTNRTVAIIGGDSRQAYLARLLAADGYAVSAHGLENVPQSVSLTEAAQADIVILPLPLSKETGLLHCRERVELEDLWQMLRPDQLVCGGQISGAVQAAAEAHGVTLVDYFQREELTVANAVATAEGAIQLAMEQLPITLWGCSCLILGCGRIAKLLAHRLRGLGADVTVAARKYGDRAWAEACGWRALPTDRLHGHLGNVRAVFNTVPSLLLDGGLLAELPPDCLCMDVASQPGIDFAAAERLGLVSVWARGLPGKVAPATAAAAIRDALYHILEERGEPV